MNPLQDLGGLISAIAAAYAARFGDLQKDFLAVEQVEQLLADVGVPDAGIAELVTKLLAAFVTAKAAAGADPGQYWFYTPGPGVQRSR